MNYKIIITLLILTFYSCSEKNNVNACDCMQILIEKSKKNKAYYKHWETCMLLSEDFKFIEKMRNCQNYDNFIKYKMEENYQNLINPPLEKNIKIENITE